VLRRAEPCGLEQFDLTRVPSPAPQPLAHAPPPPRAPRHNTRQPASLRRRLSQAFADKVMARSGPIGVALVIDSAELEVAEEISTRLHRIPR
jgi:hypothetical protein